ncbi:antibiotic biosynthesis monooxygenase [Alistipes communis]|uniref:antibiotic biosynthesis monooxygenase n=1 Tax=Alistipes communis TaxID=2585118 RepID=UPI003AF5589B
MANVIVLFEVTLKEGHSDAYLAAAAALKQELVQTDGFLGAERFTSLASPRQTAQQIRMARRAERREMAQYAPAPYGADTGTPE